MRTGNEGMAEAGMAEQEDVKEDNEAQAIGTPSPRNVRENRSMAAEGYNMLSFRLAMQKQVYIHLPQHRY